MKEPETQTIQVIKVLEELLKWYPIRGDKFASADAFGGASHTPDGMNIRHKQIETVENARVVLEMLRKASGDQLETKS